MKLLNTYECKDEAEVALQKIQCQKRLASERDGTQVIYNLFGIPSWGNFLRLGMFNLEKLKVIIDQRQASQPYDLEKHREIITSLKYAAKSFEIEIPPHWL